MKKKITRSAAPQQQVTSHYEWLLQLFVPPFLLAIIGFLFYRPSLDYAFQFDDLANITKFYSIRHQTLQSLFFANSRWISSWLNAINYRMGTSDPFAPHYYRLTNISLHIATSVLLFFVFFVALTHLKKSSFFKKNAFALSLCTAFLFLLHPVQTQTVSYVIQGRLEGLAVLSIVSMALMFLLFTRAHNVVIKGLLLGLLGMLAALSCGTKEAAIVGPVLIMLIDWFFVSQGEWKEFKRRWWLHLSLFILVFGVFLYYLKPQLFVDIFSLKREMHNNIGNTITENRTDSIKPLHYMISEFKVILHYLWIFIWPFNISVDYDWKMVNGFFAPDCFFPFLALVAIMGFIGWLLRKNNHHLVAFGMLWFFIAIAPRASIAASTELIADYKTYLSSIGWLFVLACAIVYLLTLLERSVHFLRAAQQSHYRAPASLALFSFLALPLGFATYQRNMVWRSGEEFWANILRNAPGRARAYNNYGVALSEKGSYAQAIPYFEKAAAMDTIYPDPLNNMAVAHSVLGNLDKAIAALKKSLQINPYYPEAYNNLASFLLQKGELDAAENLLNIALKIRPHYGKAFYNLGRIYTTRAAKASSEADKQRLLETTWQSYKNACTIADFDNNLAGLQEYAKYSLMLQKYDEAVVALNTMLKIDPTLLEARFNLGNAYYFMKDYERARAAYYQLAQRTPSEAKIWNNLGETCYQLQQYDDAAQFLNKATTLDPHLFNARLRLAEALSKTGKGPEAKNVLEQIMAQNAPQDIKVSAQLGLNQLQGKRS